MTSPRFTAAVQSPCAVISFRAAQRRERREKLYVIFALTPHYMALGALLLYALLREKAHKQLIAKGRNPDCPETPPYPDSPGHVDDSISAVFGNADKKK